MKKYGVREIKKTSDGVHYIYFAEKQWAHCKDEDKKFGTDDINEAYRFMASYCSKFIEVFEKDIF